jgi:hypothetical protein
MQHGSEKVKATGRARQIRSDQISCNNMGSEYSIVGTVCVVYGHVTTLVRVSVLVGANSLIGNKG